ncbi:ABC transporter ATP-binding protein [Gottschalkia acidurici 9a]|uniref:ABC transporter ATP-binding protein n=1 Tax=Gottschalkia acidurici (strain ATCC 7906 / DSM 604 / BCRC 14475 / CIP 104303 / KCTC 5404 / NCIMB 10678 / 9a) TaxID=1128398 RepID=K0AYM7_GOTA9|nr:ABC-F family ATP-binding cassette domain-containing protein [Gottschalkia acidurici]AFS77835.1 ABC transporter ATP-binding protein [Gottschalkia acidurici 9a]
MSILTVKNMSHGFGDRAIFENVSFRLLKGEHVGLIGDNGEGKSTFMNIITNKLIPDKGQIDWSNKVSVGYMDQHTELKKGKTIKSVLEEAFAYLFDMEMKMNDLYNRMGKMNDEEMSRALKQIGNIQDILDNNGFYSIDSKIEAVATGLGLRNLGLNKEVTDLSGGQRTKVLLAKLLLESPDILLLDEPTNYLDEDHIEWLRAYLKNYRNAFILISHDVQFLNSVVNVICHVENKTLTRYIGNYDSFLKEYEANKKQLKSAYEKQQEEIARLENFVKKNKARAATKGMATARQKKLDKMQRIKISSEKSKPQFQFKFSRASGKVIFEAKDLVIGYKEPLTKPLNLIMERDQKIALVGANGLGKSTLLKSLIGLIKPISGSVKSGSYQDIGYFEQEIKELNNNSVVDEVWNDLIEYNRHQIRGALARCGLTNKHIDSKISMLSGGEQAKVRLCKLINKPTNTLILDEPTNHLDVEAKRELKRALKEYEGSILLVCHESEFYRDVVTDIWNCEDWIK